MYLSKSDVLSVLIAIAIFGGSVSAQQHTLAESFPKAFEQVIKADFSDEEFENFFSKYSDVIDADDGVAKALSGSERPDKSLYPLYDFKSSKLYQDNIDKLLVSANPNLRLLAVKLIGASGDISREDALLTKLAIEDKPGIVVWAGMSLMELKTNHTTELFDFLVKYEDFGDAHMIPFYFGLDRNSIQKTAYERIDSKNDKAKILAAQALSVTEPNAKTEQILKQAVDNWDVKIKGYAISSINELRIGNLLRILQPLVNVPETRGISLAALANSPTETDRKYVIGIAEEQQTISLDILNALFYSKNIENLKYWLRSLYSKKIPADYDIYINEQPLLESDELLPDLHRALQKVTDPKILAQLVEALRGRTDDESISIVVSLLTHADQSVRYFAASVAKDNPSGKLNEPSIKELIEKNLKN